MRFETFRGPELGLVSDDVRAAMGADALVVSNSVLREGRRTLVEIVAVRAEEVEAFRRRLEPGAVPPREKRGGRPYLIALVGPTGVGKSTLAARIGQLTSPDGRRVGILSLELDGGRDGRASVELPSGLVERVSSVGMVERALERLSRCALVVVDTPPYNRRVPAANRQWLEVLERIAPDETHLVIPAYARTEIALELRDRYGRAGVTHMLLTKLDEVPGEAGVVDLAFRLDLPARWASDGPGLRADIHPAGQRILASLAIMREPGEVDLVVGTR